MALKAIGICLQDFHRTGENRDSSLGGHKKKSCMHQDPEEIMLRKEAAQ